MTNEILIFSGTLICILRFHASWTRSYAREEAQERVQRHNFISLLADAVKAVEKVLLLLLDSLLTIYE